MNRTQSIVSLDPIAVNRKRQDSVFGRLFKTRHYGGKGIIKDQPFGHYMFCGSQGSGKTASLLWYYDMLSKKYQKRGYTVRDVYSNFGIGKPVNKMSLFETIIKIPLYLIN